MIYDLTKEEALAAMEAGHRVTRESFGHDEYLHMVNGVITSEEGYNFTEWWREIEPTIFCTARKCWVIKA